MAALQCVSEFGTRLGTAGWLAAHTEAGAIAGQDTGSGHHGDLLVQSQA